MEGNLSFKRACRVRVGAGTTLRCVPIWETDTALGTGVASAKTVLKLGGKVADAGVCPRTCPPPPKVEPGTANVGAGLGGGKAACGRREGRTWETRECIDEDKPRSSESSVLTIGDAKCVAGATPLVAPIERAEAAGAAVAVAAEAKPLVRKLVVAPFVWLVVHIQGNIVQPSCRSCL